MSSSQIAPCRAAGTSVVNVASVPADHVYVRHLLDVDVRPHGVRRLPDPTPPGAESEPSRWWPPVMLEADWVEAHHQLFDVFHVHFGFDARTPSQLADLLAALRRHGKPLVLTMHDLRNPHHRDRLDHDAQLDVLVPAAAALITLTDGARREIQRRWDRDALVVPHPHVVDLDGMAALQAAPRRTDGDERFRIGVHVKSLRASMDPGLILPTLERAVDEIGDAVLQVNGHTDVLDPRGSRYDRALADVLRGCGDRVEVRAHEFLDDDALWDYLRSLDASVLPYRFGTHSGWLEACRDLGTAVIAPTCGYYAEQGPVESYVLDEHRFDETSLFDAVLRAHAGTVRPASVLDRARQRRDIASTHRALYESLLS